MTVTLSLTSDLERELVSALDDPLETAAVILARPVRTPAGLRLLARSIHWVIDVAYLERSATAMTIASEGYVPALGVAEADNAVPIWFHTHPGKGATPYPSEYDVVVDSKIAELFRLRSGADLYGTLIIAPAATGRGYAFTGRIESGDGATQAIDRIWSVGEGWQLIHSLAAGRPQPSAIFDRNIRAFGPDIQSVLGDLTIAIVGAGGTGSAIAEQLVRLGVRKFILIDADTLSKSNVTRVYGSTPADVGEPKVEVLARHLKRIAPDCICTTVKGMITMESHARQLRAADLVFGCTDDNAGRLILSRFSTYYLTPVVDIGVLLSSDAAGLLTGVDGRVTTMTPGAACLHCRGRIDVHRAAAEALSPDERKRLADEGYAPALGQTEPAVVAFTTAVAAAAVNELLDRLIGYGPPGRPTETLLRIHERETSINQAVPRPRHFCHPSQGKWGAGDEPLFLERTWPSE